MPKNVLFKNCTFALSGKLSQSHKQHEELIEKMSGKISSGVTSSVDFLVSNAEDVKAKSLKVQQALEKKVPIVSEGFIFACVVAKKVLDHASFEVLPAGSKRKSTGKAAPAPKRKRGPLKTTDAVAVIKKAGLAASARVVQDETTSGHVKASLTWDVELVLHDMAKKKDRFYNLQLAASPGGLKLWVVQHWGKTGMPGSINVEEFTTAVEGKRAFRRTYRSKTGNTWGKLDDFAEVAGKYKLLVKESEEDKAAAVEKPGRWQYYLHNTVDGKKIGWYSYEAGAAENMEKYWGQFQRNSDLHVRLLQSDYFKYEVDFSEMIQRNTTSGMRRVIRRLAHGERASTAAPAVIPEKAAPEEDEEEEDEDEEDEEVADEEDEEAADEEDEGEDEEAEEAAEEGEAGEEAEAAEEDAAEADAAEEVAEAKPPARTAPKATPAAPPARGAPKATPAAPARGGAKAKAKAPAGRAAPKSGGRK